MGVGDRRLVRCPIFTRTGMRRLMNFESPGRFYASLTLKLILAHILSSYVCELPDERAVRARSWRSSIVPRSSTLVRFHHLPHQPQGPKYAQ